MKRVAHKYVHISALSAATDIHRVKYILMSLISSSSSPSSENPSIQSVTELQNRQPITTLPSTDQWVKRTLRHVALILARPPGGDHRQRHPRLVLAAFAHHPVVALLHDHAVRCGGGGGGGRGDDHVRVVWLVGWGVVGVRTLWRKMHGQLEIRDSRTSCWSFKARLPSFLRWGKNRSSSAFREIIQL